MKPKPAVNGTAHQIEGLDDRRFWKCAEEVVRLASLQDQRPAVTTPNPNRLQVMQRSLDVAVVQYLSSCLGYSRDLCDKAIDVCRALDLIDVSQQFDGRMHYRLKG